MTSHGSERPASAGPERERGRRGQGRRRPPYAAPAERGERARWGELAPSDLDACDWDSPLTRLLLLLEIADRPTWLREAARPARRAS